MSPSIWTQCGQKSNLRTLKSLAWRVVEDQSKISTRKLVDSDAEQERLEQLIEAAKPPVPRSIESQHLHYLLFTPFRYPPLPHGSRFGTRQERGIWYGSQTIETALAEAAYWRLRFLNDTAANIPLEIRITAFSVMLTSSKAVDLTMNPFAPVESRISSPTTYADSQPLGQDMRQDGVEFCLYRSARDPKRGTNTAVFSPDAFESKTISDSDRENWFCHGTKTVIEFQNQSFAATQRLTFPRQTFEINGQLPVTIV